MKRSPITWRRALRALAGACILALISVFVAANFVLVEVRLWVLDVEMRLAWAVVAPAGLGFVGGVLWNRRRSGRGPTAPEGSGATGGSTEASAPDPGARATPGR